MKRKIAATVVCKYSGIPLAISTLWPKLRLESKDVMIGQPFSVVASHAKAWRHYNISQKRVILASLLYCTNLVEFKTPINPSESVSDVLISDLLSIVGEFTKISKEKRYNFPKLIILRENSNLTKLEIWLRTLKEAIQDYNTKNTKNIKLDDVARATVYNREFEKNFNLSIVTKRSFNICFPHVEELFNSYQVKLFSRLTSLAGGTLKQVTRELTKDKVYHENLKAIRDIIYDCVPDKEAHVIPHKILCLRWLDCILDTYNDLLSALSGDELMVKAQIINGVVLKTTAIVEQVSDKPNPIDFKGKNFSAYVQALAEWKAKQ